MDTDSTWQMIAAERRSLADLLAALDDDQWETPSLCHQWRVRDVAAHLALTPNSPGLLRILGNAVKARGSFDRVNHELAVAYARRPPSQIVAELRRDADSRRRPAITTLANLAFDTLVHGQDIAIPLGIPRPMPLRGAAEGARRVWVMGWPFWAKRRFRGYRLTATDVDWSAGTGDLEVRGPIAALLLLLTGRPAALGPLTGPGVAELRRRLTADSNGTPQPSPGPGQA
jgi:uncharacterized protein (TIGR03083 family)